MIIDTLENLARYAPMNARIKDVVAFLAARDLRVMPEGHHEIDGPEFFVNIQERGARTVDEAVLEYHRVMVDIQIPIGGPETIGYTPVSKLPQDTYDVASDAALLPGIRPESYVTVQPGEFVIFFPTDGHAPCIAEPAGFKKAVFKVMDDRC
ncbi:YhcH/YjgK/YiaL family protein [Prevotella sp. A2931]|uniref:YhcH/YjgK/YiaL family protein n=1 Tax=Prevotella illustrans TaxID=2800387 RepID=A0ABS3M332_9BACT|nr:MULTISPECIES: YhcH/YjgK/YiaL family protein [Prevotella]MBO1362562.1 YhcH/YjgK/YiaL family protein [Prevotella illustrans]PTL26730.1 YhcH/YjgK/YiaL family protein [Prevotella sp. oral taxon 820]